MVSWPQWLLLQDIFFALVVFSQSCIVIIFLKKQTKNQLNWTVQIDLADRHKLKHRRFCLSIRKHFFTVRVAEWRRWLRREVVESPSAEMLKTHLYTALGNWLWVALLEQRRWTRWHPEVPSNLNHSVVLLGGGWTTGYDSQEA